MATNSSKAVKVVENPNVVIINGQEYLTEKIVNVGGVNVTYKLVFPAFQFTDIGQYKTIKFMLDALDKNSPMYNQRVEGILHNARWVPESLEYPNEVKLEGYYFLGKPIVTPEFAKALVNKFRELNPLDRGQDGRAHFVLYPNNQSSSIGMFTLATMGIPQSRSGADGGYNGTYHPRAVLELLGKAPLYMAVINSPSAMYEKARRLFENKAIALKAALEQAAAKPAKKAKKA
jgi:hypothetical protein